MTSIIEKILASPEGGTVKLGGGDLPAAGYFVGGVVSPLVIEPGDDQADVRDNLKFFLGYLTEDTAALRSVQFVGWWTDEETGKVWVDGTSWHESEAEAMSASVGRSEIAFWDIAGQREIRTVGKEV